jgi:small subunit ribosomal protein S1
MVDQDVKLGDDIDVEIVKVNDGEGNVILSQRNIVNRKVWDDLMAKYNAGEYVEAIGKEAVKGGLIASIDGIRAFIPASQLSQRYVEKISQFTGQPMRLKIIEVDTAKKRVVASRKEVIIAESAAKKEGAWSNLIEGTVVKGIVRRFASFGAFVDIGGMDGLIHITDLSWNRSAQPQDILKINQEIDVKILSLDRERERIQLGYKQLQPRPWDNIEEKYPVGSVLTRNVVRIRPFGAFVELESGVDGLVHISQVALTRINKVEDVLQAGQVVHVKVLSVDPEAKRISLSIREALEEGAYDYSAEIPGGDLTYAHQDGVTATAQAPADAEAIAPAQEPAEEPKEEAPQAVENPPAEEVPVLEEIAQMAEEADVKLSDE